MKSKYLVIPNSSEDIKKLSGYKLLLPLDSFSVGFNEYFKVSDIKVDAYLYINRLINSFELDNLKEILNSLPTNIKGIVFEDLGVYEITKNMNFEKIFFSSHILTNSKSINEYLKYFESCVVSFDITLRETNYILENSIKKLCVYAYGHLPLSYSRRTLNSNYAKNYDLEKKINLYIKNTDYEFITNENKYGTVTYDKEIYSALNENFFDNILYYIINLFDINADDFLEGSLETSKGFLEEKTIYKLKEKAK